MSVTLGIDCTSTEMGLALWGPRGPLASVSRHAGNSHAEHIADSVDFLLKTGSCAPADITRIGVATGPGSFTGLRIGLAFVKGFVYGRAVPVLGISSLESVALCVPCPGPIVAAFDARRDEVFWARFHSGPSGLERLSCDTLLGAEAFYQQLAPGDTMVTDTLGYERSNVFSDLTANPRHVRASEWTAQRGLACARAAANEPADSSRWRTAIDISPVYLRASYAEERAGVAAGGSR